MSNTSSRVRKTQKTTLVHQCSSVLMTDSTIYANRRGIHHPILAQPVPTRYGQWSPSSTLSHRQDMPRSTDAQKLRRSKFQCCRPAHVEQFTAAPATRHELCAFQASTENISLWELVNHSALWLFAVLRLRNTLTYLLTYFTLSPICLSASQPYNDGHAIIIGTWLSISCTFRV